MKGTARRRSGVIMTQMQRSVSSVCPIPPLFDQRNTCHNYTHTRTHTRQQSVHSYTASVNHYNDYMLINGKKKLQFIHCVNSHASKTAKIIKRGYYPPSRRLHANVMLSNNTFCCVAVNTVDKLPFLSFIFAVLLSITVHLRS